MIEEWWQKYETQMKLSEQPVIIQELAETSFWAGVGAFMRSLGGFKNLSKEDRKKVLSEIWHEIETHNKALMGRCTKGNEDEGL